MTYFLQKNDFSRLKYFPVTWAYTQVFHQIRFWSTIWSWPSSLRLSGESCRRPQNVAGGSRQNLLRSVSDNSLFALSMAANQPSNEK